MIIAQISDIHANGGEDALIRFDRVLEWLKPMQVNAVIVSGDLVEDDSAQSYAAVRERLEGAGAPFFVVPGNADDVPAMRKAFVDRFGWSDADRLNVVGDLGALRVIGLDVTVPMVGHGEAGPVLDWLKAELAKSDTPTLVFLHQHPFRCGVDGLDRNMCRDADALAAVIEQAGETVIGITCGHVHRPVITRFAGRQATICPPVTRPNWFKLDGKQSEVADRPGLMIHHYADGPLISHVVSVG